MQMNSPNNKNSLKVFAIVSVLALSFWAIFYVSTEKYQENAKRRQERADIINKTEKAKRSNEVVLRKNERRDIGRTSLVYKGVTKDTILIDLYLLDLDPNQSYLKKIKEAEAQKEFSLGGVKYSVVNASDRYLKLKILNISLTP
jgi:hypothetical protein